jgi:hypothetical protein
VQLAVWARIGKFFARRADFLLARRAARWICTTVETQLKERLFNARSVFLPPQLSVDNNALED